MISRKEFNLPTSHDPPPFLAPKVEPHRLPLYPPMPSSRAWHRDMEGQLLYSSIWVRLPDGSGPHLEQIPKSLFWFPKQPCGIWSQTASL